jgi:hypothetical protein
MAAAYPLQDVKLSLFSRLYPDCIINEKEDTMLLEEMSIIYNSWSFVQQPVHPGPGANASFRALLAALDQGWLVDEPVQVLPSTRTETWTYYFILTHLALGQTCWLFVAAVPEVQRYVEQNNYQVIEGSYY